MGHSWRSPSWGAGSLHLPQASGYPGRGRCQAQALALLLGGWGGMGTRVFVQARFPQAGTWCWQGCASWVDSKGWGCYPTPHQPRVLRPPPFPLKVPGRDSVTHIRPVPTHACSCCVRFPLSLCPVGPWACMEAVAVIWGQGCAGGGSQARAVWGSGQCPRAPALGGCGRAPRPGRSCRLPTHAGRAPAAPSPCCRFLRLLAPESLLLCPGASFLSCPC